MINVPVHLCRRRKSSAIVVTMAADAHPKHLNLKRRSKPDNARQQENPLVCRLDDTCLPEGSLLLDASGALQPFPLPEGGLDAVENASLPLQLCSPRADGDG